MVSEKLGAAFIEIGVDTGGLTTGLAGAKAQVTGFGASASSAFSGLAASINPATIAIAGATAAVAALGAGIVSSVGAAADFQQSMANVAAVAGGGAEELKALSDAAREAGAGTVFSATEAAEAQYYLASAGMATEEIIASLNDTLLLAGAGGLSMGRSAEIVTNSLSQFNMEASESGRVANVLAAAASGSNTTVSQMGIAMSKVGPIANALGMSYEQTAASLMVLANAGIKGEEGGTMLRGVLASLMDISPKAAEALEEMGLSAEDVDPALHSFDEIMETLQEHGMTATQAVQLFGREAASAGVNLVKGAGDVDKFTEAVTGSTKAQEMYNTQTDTFQGAMKMLGSAVEEAKISLGNVFLPILTDAVHWLTEGVTAATNFGKSIYEMYGKVAAAEEKLGAFGVGEMVGYALNPTDAISGAFGWAKGKLGFETGKEIGEDLTEGVAEGTEGVGPAIEENLENVDGEGAGEKVGKDFGESFTDTVSKLVKEKGMSREIASMYALGASGDLGAMALWNQYNSGELTGYRLGETFDAGGSTIGFGYKLQKGARESFRLQVGDVYKSAASYEEAEKWLRENYPMVYAAMDPRQLEVAMKTARQKKAGSIDDFADVVKLKAELELGSPWDQFVEELQPTQAQIAEIQAAYESAFQEAMGEGVIIDWMTAWEDAGEEAAKVFADNLVSGMEAQDMVDRLEVLQLYDPAKFEEMGGEAALSWWQGLTDLLEQRAELKAVNIKADTSEIDNQIADAIKAGEPYLATIEANVDLNILGGPAILEGIFRQTASGLKEYTFADLLNMSPEERDLIIADTKSWGKNVLLPTIDSLIGEMNTAWDEGYTYNRTIVETALWDIIDAYHEFEGSFSKEQSKLISDLEAGTIGVEQFLDAWVKLGEGATESAKLLNGAAKTAEAACSECQEAMSEFGIWQEENADRLFSQSFIGPTDDYQKFLEQERARGAIHPEPIQLSMVYNAETAEADAALEELKESASETQYMPIEIDDAAAYSAIEKINAAASEPVIKPVYIQEYGGGNGSSMPTASASTVSWLNSICPSCTSSQGWGTSSWLPAFAEGGIVSRPIIARVGEVPEAITPLNVLFPAIQQAVAAAGGGGGVTINSTVIVQGGTVLDEDELQQVLNSRDDQLKNEIARKYLGR